MIYLDYAAHTPPAADVLDAYCAAERACWGNPNAGHCAGLAARAELARATERIAEMLGIRPEEVIYTSGASESNDLAIKGIAHAARKTGGHIITTMLEHPSVDGALETLAAEGWTIDRAGVGPDGVIDLTQLRELLREDTALVTVCAVDSELGCVQPIRQIAELLRSCPGCRLHVDATQALGKTLVSMDGVDAVTLSAHKFYGLNGAGLLLKKRELPIEPQIHGGGDLSPYRGGTPSPALAVSIETALRSALRSQGARSAYVRALNTTLRAALLRCPAVRINSPEGAVPHILNVSVQGVKGTRFQQALSEYGVCVSVKSACAARGEPSRAVYTVTGDRKNALSSWRISLSHLTTKEELGEFLAIFDRCCRELTGTGAV